ncbi:hypothetical protein EJ03DRAFT_30838 [Teratosphaeria nubilosa]|uniref:Galactose oxidase n=1 Tax=Teratosphaeria nubilosa TaxID=161662 RepID=A0A6G1LF95_9PEZI|nr:hypothetical protein EJ03DRAFT_30838 [Teratosphaeria nubilosa]
MAGTLIQGVGALIKGIYYDPTLPLKASMKCIEDVQVPRAWHTVSVVKGRAYIFGGKTQTANGGLVLADKTMQIVILPSSGVESSDYKQVAASKDAPPSRWGHTASVVDNRIYIYGGAGENDTPLDEQGRVWVYDTVTDKWTFLEAQGPKWPSPRETHSSVSSEQPQPDLKRTDEGLAPQFDYDPASIMPEPPAADSYGTLIIQGGKDASRHNLHDLWTFNIAARTWNELPEPPPPNTESPSLALIDKRLYSFSKGQTSYLDLTKGTSGLAPLSPWATFPPAASSPETQHPGDRTGAAMIPVSTGQGRNYLLLIGGMGSTGEPLDDMWALQLQPAGMTAASIKDKARSAVNQETREDVWQEVRYADAEGVVKHDGHGQVVKGFGVREGFAAAKGTEVDGACVVLWGGVGSEQRVQGDGMLITVDIA